MTELRAVGIGQIIIVRAPEPLACIGLGSCVAVIMYDPVTKLGGIVHVLLPKAPTNNPDNPEKYADTGTKKLLQEMLTRGARKERIITKLVGGAQMFPSMNLYVKDIGKANCVEVWRVLHELKVKVVAEDIEGSRGRSAFLDTNTGRVTIKSAFADKRII